MRVQNSVTLAGMVKIMVHKKFNPGTPAPRAPVFANVTSRSQAVPVQFKVMNLDQWW
jgi:hypothetical protein